MKQVKYDPDIYPYSVIKQAAKDYREIAQIQLLHSKRFVCCLFLWSRYEEETTVKEFGNYLIDLINSRNE